MARSEPGALSREMSTASAAQSSSPPGGPQVRVWFAGVNWDDIQGTDRSLVEASERPVMWVDRGYSPLRGGRWLPTAGSDLQLIRKDPLLLRLTPAIPPFSTKPLQRWLTPRLVRVQVRVACRRLGLSPESVVATFLSESISGNWGDGVPRVLFGTDDYVAGARLMGISTAWLERLESKSVRAADLVLTISDELSANWRKYRPDVAVFRNGCKITLGREAPVTEVQARTSSSQSPGDSPVVGVVGQLSSRISMEVLESLADAGFTLLLVGPVDPSWEPARFSSLCSRDSVEYVGRVAAADLPAYFARMDVGVTPYTDSCFNRASFPLKTLEYLGAGLPVVTTDLPSARWVRHDMEGLLGGDGADSHFRLASEPDDFVTLAGVLAGLSVPEQRRTRVEYASRHSWEKRALELDRSIDACRSD